MAKRKVRQDGDERRAAADYYRLNVKAVDDLVSADVSNSPKVSQAELRKYRSGLKISLPNWLKIVLIKMWFAGSVCFFFLWGLGNYVGDQLDQLFIVGLALGVVTDLLTNNVLRFFAKVPGENDSWMMCPKRRYLSLPLNILYGMLILFCVVTTYNAINAAAIALRGNPDKLALGVGPILFGTFATGWDLVFLAMKRTLRRIVADAKKSADGAGRA